MASSSDGTKLIAVDYEVVVNYLYTSADSGATWTHANNAPSAPIWTSVASSSNGAKLAAVQGKRQHVVTSGLIYTSADSGKTWSHANNAPSSNWASVASSSDGAKLVAVDSNGFIYTSANSGKTWVK